MSLDDRQSVFLFLSIVVLASTAAGGLGAGFVSAAMMVAAWLGGRVLLALGLL